MASSMIQFLSDCYFLLDQKPFHQQISLSAFKLKHSSPCCFSAFFSKCLQKFPGNASEMEEVLTGAEGFIYSTLSRQQAVEALQCLQGPQSSNDVSSFEGYYLQIRSVDIFSQENIIYTSVESIHIKGFQTPISKCSIFNQQNTLFADETHISLSLTPVIPHLQLYATPSLSSMLHSPLYVPSHSRNTIPVTFWAPSCHASLLLLLPGLYSSSFPSYTCPQFQPALFSSQLIHFFSSIGIYYCTFFSHYFCYFFSSLFSQPFKRQGMHISNIKFKMVMSSP